MFVLPPLKPSEITARNRAAHESALRSLRAQAAIEAELAAKADARLSDLIALAAAEDAARGAA